MTEQVQYRVRRGFKYGRKHYKPGDLWQPEGNKWDGQIIDTGMVVTERVEPEKATKGKAANGVKSG